MDKPKGTLQESKLDPHRERIIEFLKQRVTKSAIARMLGTSRMNLINCVKTRGLEVPKGERLQLAPSLKWSRRIQRSPAVEIKAPKHRTPLPVYLSKQEVARLLEMPDTHTIGGLRDQALLEVL